MNNIYVDELPDCCGNCSLCCKDDLGYWCQATILIYIDERFVAEKRLKSCPLKSLSTKLAEERKKVLWEIRKRAKRTQIYIKPTEKSPTGKEKCFVYEVSDDFLDQIERGE